MVDLVLKQSDFEQSGYRSWKSFVRKKLVPAANQFARIKVDIQISSFGNNTKGLEALQLVLKLFDGNIWHLNFHCHRFSEGCFFVSLGIREAA